MFGESVFVDLDEKRKHIEKLRKDVEKKLETLEYNTARLKGVGNISHSDFISVLMYIDALVANNGHGFSPYMEPLDNVKDLLIAYKIL